MGGTVDSQVVVKALVEVDPGFVQLCETLFGKAADPVEIWEYLYTPEGVSKMGPGSSDLSVPGGLTSPKGGVLVPKMMNSAPKAQLLAPKKPTPIIAAKADEDSVEVVWSGEFAKRDSTKHQAFGWASVVSVNGEPIFDLQGDFMTPEDIEDAAYIYVQKSRVGGSQHARDEWDRPVQAGHLIESKVWTDEKYAAFAKSIDVPVEVFDNAPRGWEVGFQYAPGQTWEDIEKGRKTGFSIHGRGKRIPVGL